MGIVHPLKDLSPLQQTEVCGQCHGRSTHKTQLELAFQTGFRPGDIDMTSRVRFWNYSSTPNPAEYSYFYANDWARRNRQQWQDFTKSAHFNKAGMSGITCHTFHGKWEEAQLRQKPQALCEGCHTLEGRAKRPNVELFMGSPMQKAGVTCVDCHMSKIGVRSDKTPSGPRQWDTSSHTFLVATPELQRTIGVRSACVSCHFEKGPPKKMPSGVESPLFGIDDLHTVLTKNQEAVRELLGEVQALLKAVTSAKPEAVALVERAQARLSLVLLDGSMGAHNAGRAIDLLTEAKALATQAAKSQ
jgi:predicted CXXCH cytochrome family protein